MNRVTTLVVAGAVTVGALTGCGGGTSTASDPSPAGAAGSASAPTAPTVRTLNVKTLRGKVSGDTGRITVPLGTPIVLSVSSDVADEIHVHGYDRTAKVPAGTTGSVVFTANTPGVFDVELENAKLQLLQLQVG